MKKQLAAAILLAFASELGLGKTVGLWKDARSAITDGMIKTLQEAGWQTVILQGRDLSDDAKLDALDALFLPGGWNAYFFADFKARRALVRYVAGGGGILAGAFRSGYVRTANRPIFPQVGAVHNRVNGPFLSASGDSELARAIDKPFCPGGRDHLVVKLGPLGKVFAVNGDDPVGVYGEVYGGRCVVFGAFLGLDAVSNAMAGTERNVLLKSIEWLAGAPKLDDAAKAKHRAQADLDFLRRELLWDWTHNERGPDREPGILPQIRNKLALDLESRQFKLEYMGGQLSGGQQSACREAEAELKEAMTKLDRGFRNAMAAKAAQIEKMSAAELLAENPFLNRSNVLARIEAMPGRTDAEKKAMKSGMNGGMASKTVAMFLHGAAISEELLPEARKNELIARADKAIAAFRPAVKAAKAAKLAAERRRDLPGIPGLVAQCASTNAAARRDAVLELGRIGEPGTASALIRALGDADEAVRVNAILGLGWMQSREAVPELIKLAESADLPLRRRAAQALGQIGDARAIKPLMALAGHPDVWTAENAVMGLGWLKAKQAVPALIDIAAKSGPKDSAPRALRLAAIRALGHIGEASSVPALEKLAAEAKDAPKAERGNKPITNIYSSSKSLGLQVHAQLAVAEIKAGGRRAPGIRQAGFLAGRDKFYGLTRRFNALAGRTSTFRMEDTSVLWPYVWESGMTGIHDSWGRPLGDPEAHAKMVEAAGELGLLWIDVLPGPGSGVEKAGAEIVILRYEDEPAFHGFWSEETWPEMGFSGAEFDAWLKSRHGADYRKKLGFKEHDTVLGRDWNTWSDKGGFNRESTNQYAGALKSAFLQCAGEKLADSWRESQEWMRGLRKGCAFTYSISEIQLRKYPGMAGKAGSVIDANGPETYQCFGRYNGYLMEMFMDGEARPAMAEFYNWYTPSEEHAIRGFAQHLMHGGCFYSFAFHQVFEHGSTYDMWNWDAARWGNVKKVFQKARKIRDYIAIPASAANVGLLCADLGSLAFDPVNRYGASLPLRWDQHQCALWTALSQSQIPADIIWAETMTPEKLARYRVLVLMDGKMILDGQAALIRDWVRNGGTLICGGTTSLFDPSGEPRNDYLLADLFGVSYAGDAAVSDPDRNDTFCWKPGAGETVSKVVSGLVPGRFNDHIHREVKPVKSLGLYKVADGASAVLPGIAPGAACEYDMPLGYDRVKPSSAKLLAAFANGDPALTVNEAGRGLCFFWTPAYPGLCHVASQWEMQSNKYDFWPNVRELLAAMVRGGLAHQGAALPAEVTGVSKEVEVTVRQQPEHGRWMVHLLDYDPKSDSVKGAEIIVHPPEGKAIKRMFYPDTDTEAAFAAAGGGAAARLRDFEVHDMVVIEFE